MKKILIALLLLTAFGSCNRNNYYYSNAQTIKPSNSFVKKEIPVTGTFDRIAVAGSHEVVYSQGTTTSVSVRMPDNLAEHMDIKVVDGTLRVRCKDGVQINGRSKVVVTASSPELKNAGISGSGYIGAKGSIKGKEIALAVSGSGKIEVGTMTYNTASAKIAGSGEIEIDMAKAEAFNATVYGSEMEMDMAAGQIIIAISGSGKVEIDHADIGTVDAAVAGSGKVELEGKARKAKFAVSGSGEVSADDLIAGEVSASVAGSGKIECYAVESISAAVSGSGKIEYGGAPRVDKAHAMGKGSRIVKK